VQRLLHLNRGFRGECVYDLSAVRHLVMAEVQIATIRNQVLLSLFTDFENFSVFKPAPQHEKSVNELFDQVIAWSSALKALR
jgi:hypothetical protein